MCNSMKLFAFFVLAGFVVVQASDAFGYDGHKRRCGPWGKHLVGHLDLTPEQKSAVTDIHAKYKEMLTAKRVSKKNARIMLQAALKTSVPEPKVRELFAQHQKSRQEFAKLRFEKVLAIWRILSPEQRQKFDGLKGKRHFRKCRFHKHKRFNKGMHPPPSHDI